MNTETGSSISNASRGIKLSRFLTPTPFSARYFLCGALCFAGPHLCLERLVLFRQGVTRSGHCFEIVSQLPVLSLKFRYLGLQLLVLLRGFRVRTASEEKTQHNCYSKVRPAIFPRHASFFLHGILNRNWANR
jgi:hypothetical protein